MPVVPNINRRIKRIRHENRCNPPIPTGLDFELPMKYMQIVNEQDIPLKDSVVPRSKKRYLVFPLSKNIDALKSYGIKFIDGIFRSYPEKFYQVYTVNCFVDSTTFLCFYALLPDKRQDRYNPLWSNLKSDVKAPVSVMMDFTMASIFFKLSIERSLNRLSRSKSGRVRLQFVYTPLGCACFCTATSCRGVVQNFDNELPDPRGFLKLL